VQILVDCLTPRETQTRVNVTDNFDAEMERLTYTQSYALQTLHIVDWRGPISAEMQNLAVEALEAGKVILLPDLPFRLEPGEEKLLDPSTSDDWRKNISLDPRTGKIDNAAFDAAAAAPLAAMMARFGQAALGLLQDLLRRYAPTLESARTSFRPIEIQGRHYSPRHDDRRLHIDAFPSRPTGGKRILRVFTNIADDSALRHWCVGEPFADFARKFMPRLRRPVPGSAWLYGRLGITKGTRKAYDHYMLGLHNAAKLDSDYQARAPRADLRFAPGATWVCFTDQVLHAAVSGHAALERTFHLPVAAMMRPETSPLRVLERIAGRPLA
jgi:3-deoxy-D-manno-oct-2-ulosonic acid (Kdo) hydroxylase